MPVEKVYLHTDKPYYTIGDTLWFKSYLFNRIDKEELEKAGKLTLGELIKQRIKGFTIGEFPLF